MSTPPPPPPRRVPPAFYPSGLLTALELQQPGMFSACVSPETALPRQALYFAKIADPSDGKRSQLARASGDSNQMVKEDEEERRRRPFSC